MAEVEDGDECEENDEQSPDLISALPWDLEHVPLEFKRLPVEETIQRSLEFYNLLSTRRTVRFFSSDPIPADVIRNIIRAAGMLFRLHMKLLFLQIP
jgi:iodotyrosine deiodinase